MGRNFDPRNALFFQNGPVSVSEILVCPALSRTAPKQSGGSDGLAFYGLGRK